MNDRIARLLVVALAAASIAGCAPEEASDDSETSSAAASAPARQKLEGLTGSWRVTKRTFELSPMRDAVRIVVTDDAVDPTTGATKGTRLRIMRDDEPSVPAIDRAPFLNVDEGKDCESVVMDGMTRLRVCHATILSGDELTHRVTVTAYAGYVIPTGWQTAVQTLTKTAGGLRYTYAIDGDLVTNVELERPPT